MQEIIDEYSRKLPYYVERCGTLLKDVLLCAARVKKEELLFTDKNKVSAIKAYVKEHFAEPITNESVSKHLSYHKNYMNRNFKDETGQTLHQFLLSYRMQIAVSLFLSVEYTVSDVARQVGFSEASHFSACSKKSLDTRPVSISPSRQGPPPQVTTDSPPPLSTFSRRRIDIFQKLRYNIGKI